MRLLLVVEDDYDIRTSLAALLSDLGYSVCDAADGAKALDKLRSLRPDLVVLDYGLPGPEDGAAFPRAKAADQEIGGVPVIVVSGYELPAEIAGTVAVVRKPFDFTLLAALIERVVGPPATPGTNAAA